MFLENEEKEELPKEEFVKENEKEKLIKEPHKKDVLKTAFGNLWAGLEKELKIKVKFVWKGRYKVLIFALALQR